MADFDIAAARAAGYTNAEIEQVLAMSGRAPREVRAMMGAPALGLGDSLAGAVRSLLGPATTPPQAMTRVTHTPIRWGATDSPTAYGEYSPDTGDITMNPERLPQTNPDAEYMSNVLRHESVHGMMADSDVRKRIAAYFDANPDMAATGRENLSRIDPGAGATNWGMAAEAPAYRVQGYQFGMPDQVDQYRARMTPAQRAKYEQLLPRKR